ncbi:hypothetical protein [Dyella lipolytica]|uniref:Uncharacterized protein n=1 Tax=Dyella lipolytica TaxID=1867835 RepID=A0ABW8IVU6_9GAMM|nr:hypothetical protein [Dyella lipolytica]
MKQDAGRLKMCAMLIVLLAIGAGERLSAQNQQHSYPTMAPLSEYLMGDRDAEIALARSAAPKTISGEAKILVLGPHGYVTAVEGKNGFVCVVDRSWTAEFENPEFWNPKLRGPICFNRQAAQSILPITYKRTELALAGQSKNQIMEGMKAAFAKKQLPPLAPGGMSYMMSKGGYLNDAAGHWIPHLMFYTSREVDWGADLPGSPIMLNPQLEGDRDPIKVFMIPAGKWSDGTAAPVM